VAVCVDCHLPTSFVGKYIAKADNGYRHSTAFTFQNFHEPIQIGKRNAEILQANCLRCHRGLVHSISVASDKYSQDVSCVHCHHDVGHGEYVGLGKAPRDRGERL
jgi:cytochrome c nitrite reductase small subunit